MSTQPYSVDLNGLTRFQVCGRHAGFHTVHVPIMHAWLAAGSGVILAARAHT